MTQDSWKLFPRLIEQKINGLLDHSVPNNTKAFQLYKACKVENLWRNSFELFNVHLCDFFSVPKTERAKSYFDQFLDRPMDRALYGDFELNFRTAIIDSKHVQELANWTHRLLKDNCNTEKHIISMDVLIKTIKYITNPPEFEKYQDIEFEDFCIAWKKIVFKLFGKKYNTELELVLKEIRWLNKLQKNEETRTEIIKLKSPGIYLTQTEIDWVESIKAAVFNYKFTPDFPLSRGPEKQSLINLERATCLYNIILSTTKNEIKQHQESARSTILHHCNCLLTECIR